MNVEDPTLQALVADRKGDRSYEQLAALSDGRLSRARIQQIATREMKAFPDAATLAGLAQALDVPVQEVVLATARSLGLQVRGGVSGDALLVPGGKNLSTPAQDALLTMARELSKAGATDGERGAARVVRDAQRDGITATPRRRVAAGGDDTHRGGSSADVNADHHRRGDENEDGAAGEREPRREGLVEPGLSDVLDRVRAVRLEQLSFGDLEDLDSDIALVLEEADQDERAELEEARQSIAGLHGARDEYGASEGRLVSPSIADPNEDPYADMPADDLLDTDNLELPPPPSTDGAGGSDRPWEQDEYGLAAKRGRNRGREARQQQDREAEDGGA